MPTKTPKTPSKVHPLDEVKQMINRLEDKVEKRFDKVNDKVDHLAEATVRNTTSLEEHIRGVRALEARNDMLKTEMNQQRDELLKMSTAVLAAVAPKKEEEKPKSLLHKVKHFFKTLHEIHWILLAIGGTSAGASILHWILRVF